MTSKEQIRISLIKTIERQGFPAEFGMLIADSLGTEKQMERMVSWVIRFQPDKAEDIADEMLAIKDEFEKYKNKAIAENANRKYNDVLNNGLEPDEGIY